MTRTVFFFLQVLAVTCAVSPGPLSLISDVTVLLQKLKAVSDCSSCGLEFELQGIQASSAETAAAVPFTLTFR